MLKRQDSSLSTGLTIRKIHLWIYTVIIHVWVIMGYWPCLGRASASLRRLVRLSAPSWFRIPGSISVSCLVSAWPVMVKVLAAREACTLGLLKWMTVPWFVNMLTCKRPKCHTVYNKNNRQYRHRFTLNHSETKLTDERLCLPLQYQRYCWRRVFLGRTGVSCHLRLLFCVQPSSFCEHYPMGTSIQR